MPLTNYTRELILNHTFRSTTWGKPAGIYMALFTSSPDLTGGGAESAYTGYARVAVTQADAEWTLAAVTDGMRATNVNAVAFPTPTANGAACTHYGFYNASTGGDLMAYTALSSSITPTTSTPISFAAGEVYVELVDSNQRVTDLFGTKVLDHILRTATWAKPTAITYDLCTTMPSKAGTGNTNFSGSGYTQGALNPSDTNYSAPSGTNRQTQNSAEISFGTPSANWTGIDGQILSVGSDIFLLLNYGDAPRTYATTLYNGPVVLPINQVTFAFS